MEVGGVIVLLLLCLIAFLIVAAVIRYAVDSSKTSKRIEDLISEVHSLRIEMNKQNNNRHKESRHIIDEKV